jgi:carboxypeptidase C (cathepsin A)
VVNNTYDAAKHFVNFLYNFLQEWDLKDNPIYLAGESYAGHYIPAFARYIISNATLGFNLRGVMIGDGLVDPVNQFNNYDSYMYSAGIISNEGRDTTTFMQNQAILNILGNNFKQASDYTNWIINNDTTINKFYGGVNILNYKQYEVENININYDKYLNANKK